MSSNSKIENLIQLARTDLAQRLNLAEENIRVQDVQFVEWSDTSLGCPKSGRMYAQVITPGALIVLEANDRTYEYHSDLRRVFLCEK